MSNIDLRVKLGDIELKNPVVTASGTFTYQDSGSFYDVEALGAVTTKGVAPIPWDGNSTPRIAESYGGMLNSVGLQNPGIDAFIAGELAMIEGREVKVIVNVVGTSIRDYVGVVERLEHTKADILEINISCPNVDKGGMSFGVDPKMAAAITRAVRQATTKPIFVKLTPNVTDITEVAKAVEYEGADGISMINTLLGMKIDVWKKKPVLAKVMGGLSGPCIMPIAVRMVYQVSGAVKIPIIGGGGIATGIDAVEFIMAGAKAVSVGTAALINPTAPIDILNELKTFMKEEGYNSIEAIHQGFATERERGYGRKV